MAMKSFDSRQVWEPGVTQSMNSCAKTKIDTSLDSMTHALDRMRESMDKGFKDIESLLRTQIIAEKRHRRRAETKDQQDPKIERMNKGFKDPERPLRTTEVEARKVDEFVEMKGNIRRSAKANIDKPLDPMIECMDKGIERMDKGFKDSERLLRTQIIAEKRHWTLKDFKHQHETKIERRDKGCKDPERLRVIHSDVPRLTEEDSELMGHYTGGDTARAITVRTKVQIDGLTNADESVGELARPRVASRTRPTRGRLRADESVGELARPRAAMRTRPIRGRLRRGIDVGRCIQAGLRRRP